MADVKVNFSSQWPSVQVAKVTYDGASDVQDVAPSMFPYVGKIPHNLGYPPLCLNLVSGVEVDAGEMELMDVDSEFIYFRGSIDNGVFIIYAIDISTPYDYPNYDSAIGEVLQDGSKANIDLRKFLLHSRAVSPMLLNVSVKDITPTDFDLRYTSPMPYPTFQFGYVRFSPDNIVNSEYSGIWRGAPLQGQSYPVLRSDGFDSLLQGVSTISDKASIITLRNPAIITTNTINITL